MRRIMVILFAVALAGCANTSPVPRTANQGVAAAEVGYTAAAHGELVYLHSAQRDPGVATEMKRLDQQAYTALLPLRAAAQGGGSVVSTGEVEAAQAAVQALTKFMAQHNVNTGGA